MSGLAPVPELLGGVGNSLFWLGLTCLAADMAIDIAGAFDAKPLI